MKNYHMYDTNHTYHTVLFDLDGTLTDSAIGILGSVKYALNTLGLPLPDEGTLKSFLGPPLVYSYSHFCGLNEEQTSKAIKLYRKRYMSVCAEGNALYSGIVEMLDRLSSAGKTLIVATSKPEVFAVKIADRFDITRYFKAVCGAALDGSRDAKSDVIRYALDICNVSDLDGVVMVGDRKHDIEGAKTVGIDSIGVLYGYGSRDELEAAGCGRIAEDPAKVAEIILSS